jgi:phospholipid-binding lipoprotein MlaA
MNACPRHLAPFLLLLGAAMAAPVAAIEPLHAQDPTGSASVDALAPDPAGTAGLEGLEESAPYLLEPWDEFGPQINGDYSPEASDPWETANRRVYAFNRGFDRVIFLPVARGYQRLTPPLARRGVTNFFDNLIQPVAAVNLLLQGKPGQSATALGRFTLNATLGIGGILDPAGHAGIPKRNADFGQTFSRWGWIDSRYMVLPIFGPSTARDTWGKAINAQISPVSEVAQREGAWISVLYGVDARARALSAEAMLAGAADEYALVRDAYLQYRRCQIIDCSEELPEYLLPSYEFEIPDFEAIRR